MYEKVSNDDLKLPQYNTPPLKIQDLDKTLRHVRRGIYGIGLIMIGMVIYITIPNKECVSNDESSSQPVEYPLYRWNIIQDNKDNILNEFNEEKESNPIQMDTCWFIDGDLNLANLLCKSQFNDLWHATELLPCEYGTRIICSDI